jgi:pimeloyl-ACP methyl ester carboxylesterase
MLGAMVCTLVFLMLILQMASVGSQTSKSILPTPSGPHHVGTRLLKPLVDKSRPDPRFPKGFRTIPVQLWYPTSVKDGARSLYFPDSQLLETLKANSSAPDVVESWRALRTDAIQDAAMERGKFPLIIFSPGFDMAREYYTSWAEEFASQGFVVATVDHPFAGVTRIDGTTFTATPNPKGPREQTGQMATDVSFVLGVLLHEHGVDKRKIAAVGHSIGGAAALDACRVDMRIGACVNLDGDPSFGTFQVTGVGRTFLVIHQKPAFPDSKPDGELATMGRKIDAAWQEVIGKQSAPAIRLMVLGTGHLSFSDALFTRPDLVKEGGGVLTDPLLVLHGTTEVIVSYLRNSFNGHPDVVSPLPEFIKPAKLGSSD